jgi:hypothetical protein
MHWKTSRFTNLVWVLLKEIVPTQMKYLKQFLTGIASERSEFPEALTAFAKRQLEFMTDERMAEDDEFESNLLMGLLMARFETSKEIVVLMRPLAIRICRFFLLTADLYRELIAAILAVAYSKSDDRDLFMRAVSVIEETLPETDFGGFNAGEKAINQPAFHDFLLAFTQIALGEIIPSIAGQYADKADNALRRIVKRKSVHHIAIDQTLALLNEIKDPDYQLHMMLIFQFQVLCLYVSRSLPYIPAVRKAFYTEWLFLFEEAGDYGDYWSITDILSNQRSQKYETRLTNDTLKHHELEIIVHGGDPISFSYTTPFSVI